MAPSATSRTRARATIPAFIAADRRARTRFDFLGSRRSGRRLAPTFGDLDDDGDLDLVTGDASGLILYLENTGSASNPAFIVRTGTANPLDIDAGYFSVPCLGDLDLDGDLDAILGNSDGDFLFHLENIGTASAPERSGCPRLHRS